MFSILNNLSCDLFVGRHLGLRISECEQHDEDGCLNTNCHQTTTFSGGFMDQTLVLHVMQEVIKHWTAGYVYSAKAKYSDLCFFVRVGIYICMCNDNKFTTWGTLYFLSLLHHSSPWESSHCFLSLFETYKMSSVSAHNWNPEVCGSRMICHPVRTNLE